MAGPPYADDKSIADDADLWRRINPKWVVPDDNHKSWRVSSAAFDNSADGSPLSVLLADVVLETGRTPRDVLASFDEYSLASITAGTARANEQGVAYTPTQEESAHRSVFGPKTKSIKRRLAQAATWVIPPSGRQA